MKEVLQQFCFDGEPVACELFGNGHINRTYRVVCENGKEYILQRVSRVAFRHPEQLIENIDAVTAHIARKPELHQQTLHLIETKDGKKFYIAPDGEFWRAYSYISGGICLEAPRTPQDFYEAAVAFGGGRRGRPREGCAAGAGLFVRTRGGALHALPDAGGGGAAAARDAQRHQAQ